MPTKNTHRKWGKRVADERLRLRWSQNQLAAALEVDKTTVWRIERGDCAPSDLTRVRLAHVFGRRVEELFPYPTLAQVEREGRAARPTTTSAVA